MSAARTAVVALLASLVGTFGCTRTATRVAMAAASTTQSVSNAARPTIFIAGNSTAARGAGERQQGWGVPFADYFDTTKVNVVNRARGGRSSRTFVAEGSWERLIADVKPGDIVLIEFSPPVEHEAVLNVIKQNAAAAQSA